MKLINKEDKEKFFGILASALTENELQSLIQEYQWIILNLKSDEYIEYASVISNLMSKFSKENTNIVDIDIEDLDLSTEQINTYLKYKQFDKERKSEVSQIKKISEYKLENVESETKKQEYIDKTTILAKWLRLCDTRSYYNEIPAKLFFHALLGQYLKDCNIIMHNGKSLDLRTHVFISQRSRTGKGQLMNVLCDVVKKLNMVYGDLKGDETDAVLLRRFSYNSDQRKGYNFESEIPGDLEKYEFYLYREAKCLLQWTSQTSQTSKYYLHILEGESIPKSLEKWNGHRTLTFGKGTLIATTRPIEQLNRFVVESGLMQRCLCYMRQIPEDVYQKMLQKDNLYSLTDDPLKAKETYNIKINEIVSDLIDLKKWALENFDKIRIKDINEIKKYTLDVELKLNTTVNENLKHSSYLEIAKSFISGWSSMIIKLMYHNAIIRKSLNIELQDAIAATEIIKTLYKELENWIQLAVTPDFRAHKMRVAFINLIKYTIKQNEKIGKRTELKDIVLTLTTNPEAQIGESRAYQIINDLTSLNNSPFIIERDIDDRRHKFIKIREVKLKNENDE